MSDEAKAGNVIEALTRVMRDLPGIGKDQTASAQQGGYKYRGIEQITIHTQALFAQHGVLFVPRVLSWEIRDITINDKPWMDVVEEIEYTVYGPGGTEDRITVGPLLAIGRDNSDKGGNKCLTQAYKYALIQALNIADAKDDADGTTHVADDRQRPARGSQKPAQDDPQVARLKELNRLLTPDQKKAYREWREGEGIPEQERSPEQIAACVEYVEGLTKGLLPAEDAML